MENVNKTDNVLHIEPNDLSIPELHHLILGGVAPRPIALVSTISSDGINNLSPFSFFNAFSVNPPIIVFSPSRRGRDASVKDTLNNLTETKECVVQAVTYPMIQQVSLASTEYPPDVDEFIKSGLTPVPSDIVKPKRVKESPFQMESIVRQIIPLGDSNASGNLVICEVVKFHIDKKVIRDGIIHPVLIDLVGRNSADFYTHASGKAIFEVEKPGEKIGMGFDQLPQFLKQSHILTANNLGQLANCKKIPSEAEVMEFINTFDILDNVCEELFERYLKEHDFKKMMQVAIVLAQSKNPKAAECFELTAKTALEQNQTDFAWKTVIYSNLIKL